MADSAPRPRLLQGPAAWWFALALFGYEVVAGLGAMADLDTSGVAIAYRALVALGAVALLASRLASGRFKAAPAWLLLVVFMALYLARLAVDTVEPVAPLFNPAWSYWVWAVGACFLPCLAAAQYDIHASDDLRRAVFAVLLVATACALWSALASGAGEASADSTRLSLNALNPISMGHLGASVLLLAVWWFCQPFGRFKHPALYLLVVAAVLGGGFLLMASNSRGPLVAVALSLVVVGLMLPLQRALLFFGVLAGSALGFATAAAFLEEAYGFTLYTRLFGQSQLYEVNTLSRLDRYGYALEAALDKPFLGAGLEVPVHGGYPHNILIEVALNLGLPGVALFVLLVAIVLWGAVRRVARERRHGWLLVLFTQYFVAVQFSAALYQATHFWLLLGALLALRARPATRAAAHGIPARVAT